MLIGGALLQELKLRGLSTAGSKAELVERLRAAGPPEPAEPEWLDPDSVHTLTVRPAALFTSVNPPIVHHLMVQLPFYRFYRDIMTIF